MLSVTMGRGPETAGSRETSEEAAVTLQGGCWRV